MLDENIQRNPARRFPSALKVLSNVIGNQLGERLLKVFVKNGSPPCADLSPACAPVSFVILKNRKAEPDHFLVVFRRGWQFCRLNRTQHVVYPADKQFVFTAEVRIEG
jgi:hypothetical protein